MSQLSIARIRNYWLGGSHYSEADRKFGDHVMVCVPWLPYLVRQQRAMVGRMVQYLLASGVRQFIDLGSGVPTTNYVHGVAQAIEPESRVLYVDIDPGIVRDGRELLTGNDNARFLQADIRQPDQVLESPELRELIDLSEPVAVSIIETLLQIPDSDKPAAMVTAYKDAICSGSYLGLSYFSTNQELRSGLDLFNQMFGDRCGSTLRDLAQLEEFFIGFDLVEPGVVPVPLWRPVVEEETVLNPEHAGVYVGLGRKP